MSAVRRVRPLSWPESCPSAGKTRIALVATADSSLSDALIFVKSIHAAVLRAVGPGSATGTGTYSSPLSPAGADEMEIRGLPRTIFSGAGL